MCLFQAVALKLQKEVKHYLACVKGDLYILAVFFLFY